MNVPPSESFYQTTYNQNGYGGMQYYSSSTCGYVNNNWAYDGCTNSYETSEIKYVVDAWAAAKVPNGLQEARLIIISELDNLGYEYKNMSTSGGTDMRWVSTDEVPSWLSNSNYVYWTMIEKNGSNSTSVLGVTRYNLNYLNVFCQDTIVFNHETPYVVRPVIVLSKSVL